MIFTEEQDPRLPGWLNTLLNHPPFCLPVEWCWTLVMFSFGFKEKAFPDNPWRYILCRAQLGGKDLFWNSMFSVSVGIPFRISIQIRWAVLLSPSYLQVVLGWKPNGRFALTVRVLDDASAAAGTLAANPGEAQGWVGGVK